MRDHTHSSTYSHVKPNLREWVRSFCCLSRSRGSTDFIFPSRLKILYGVTTYLIIEKKQIKKKSATKKYILIDELKLNIFIKWLNIAWFWS